MDKYKFHVNKYSVSMIIIGIILNCMGRIIATNLYLPFYMDAYGTYLVSIVLGPLAGALAGLAMNLIFAIGNPGDLLYSIVSVAGGIVVGKMLYDRDKSNYLFTVVVTGLAASFTTVLFSTPINMFLKDGMTGNIWGDALVEMTYFRINVKVICCILGESIVNLPDKLITLMFMVTAVEAFKKEGIVLNLGQDEEFLEQNSKRKAEIRHKYEVKRYERALKKNNLKKNKKKLIIILIIPLLASYMAVGSNLAKKVVTANLVDSITIDEGSSSTVVKDNVNSNINVNYTGMCYGIENGLNTAQINDIAQTGDGYIYVGTYSGLYRYDGINYSLYDLDDRISNVKKLMIDNLDRLWIATNDSGLAYYNYETDEIRFFTTDEGLCSDSIRDMCDDGNGHLYVATASYLAKINLVYNKENVANYTDDTFVITNMDKIEETSYADSICSFGSEKICGVNKDGEVFVLDSDNLVSLYSSSNPEYTYISIEYSSNENCFYIGTSSNIIEKARFENNQFTTFEYISTGDLININYINYSTAFEGCFISAENGIGYLSESSVFEDLTRSDFNNSVRGMIVDKQNNIWFASATQGVLKLSLNPFVDVISTKGVSTSTVNCCYVDGKSIYLATDTGIITVDSNGNVIENEKFDIFDGIKVRHILKDSHKTLWVSCNGDLGLIAIKDDGSVINYNSNDSGVIGEYFRFTMELSDGRILAASDLGISFIEDGRVVKTLGSEDGIEVTKILSAFEEVEGDDVTGEQESRIYIGTDGAGVYEIREDKIVNHISKEDGLASQIILKIVDCYDGRLYVTSNDIYYHKNTGEIRRLNNFPYSNNYDIYIDKNRNAYVSSSCGMFVVNEQDLLANEETYTYTLLDYKRGLDTGLVANSFDYIKNNKLYICCNDGARVLNLDSYGDLDTHFTITISKLSQGDNEVKLVNGVYSIPAGRGQIAITPCILNYTVSDPLVYVELEGIDDSGAYYRQSSMETLNYGGIPYGLHKLRIRVVSDSLETSYKEAVFLLYKNAKLYERFYYRVYLVINIVMFVAILAWILSKMGNIAVINRQYNQIREAKEEAEHANQTKSRFLAQMSHEIRTPINAILGMDEMILRESNEADIRVYAADINTASNTLLSLINDILDSSKIDSGKMEIAPIEYELSGLIYELVNMISWKAQAKDLSFTVEADPNLPKKLYGDDVRIRQVITNILTNAVKYTDTGGVWLRVSGKNLGDKLILHVEVEDTGIGIEEENISKLFVEFERLDMGRNRNVEGTGLGMNITIKLLELMGSKLEVKSIYGKGSKFFFDLEQPIVDHDPMGDINKTRVIDKKESTDKFFVAENASVLVVDDNAMNRKVFKSLLKKTRIQISEASSGKESITMAKASDYDIIFMDHMMPGMDGIEAKNHIRELPNCQKTPIFALTANAMAGAKEEYLSLGFDGFLSKPISIDKLLKTLEEYLPKDTIHYLTEEEQEEEDIIPRDNFVEEMPAVEGLDWDYAYLHLPEKEMLMESIDSFYELIETQAKKLEDFFDNLLLAETTSTQTEKTDINLNAFTAYRIQVHAMKSAAAIIGIVPLSGMAKILEFAAKDGKLSIIKAMHKIFIEEWLSYRDKLSLVANTNEVKGELKKGDLAMLNTMLDMLNQAMESLDIDTADEIMSKVKNFSFGDEVDALMPKLLVAVKDLDEDAVQEIAKEMKSFL